MAETKNQKHKSTHKAAFPVGLAVVVLALIGAVTIIVSAINGISTAVKKDSDFSEYNTLLTPVVLIDPDTFDDITKADMNQLIEMSVWSLLKSNISPDTYTTTSGGLAIPKEDVEKEFVKLFGTEVKPVHATAAGYGYEFVYDATAGTYTIPLTGIVPIYTPMVVGKDETADTVVLTVACLAGDAWEQGTDGKMIEPAPDKYIKVTLREKNGSYYISAIQNTTTPEVATTVPSSETTTENQDLLGKAEEIATETTAAEETSDSTTQEATS